MRKLVFICMYLSLTIPCAAGTIYVNWDGTGDYTTIQAGINAAVYGDTVQVGAGTYFENITLSNGVRLIGEVVGADPNNTIIDANFNGSVVTSTSCDPNTVLEGFTITNGTGTETLLMENIGGGMLCMDSRLTIRNCTFSANSAALGDGGGVFCGESSPKLINCTFNANSAHDGGGMFCAWDSNPELVNCTFIANYAWYGGGLNIYYNSRPTITDCTFIDNAGFMGGGGMFNYVDSSPTVTGCTFTNNSAGVNGGGMYNSFNCLPIVIGCTFSENSADYGGGMYNYTYNNSSKPTVINCTFIDNSADYGGGMYNMDRSPKVSNCIFSGNSADYGGGMYNSGYSSSPTVAGCTFTGNTAKYDGGGISNNYHSSSTLINCIFWNNSASNGNEISLKDFSAINVDYCDVQGGQAGIYDNLNDNIINWGIGNIDTDPLFVDVNNNFHLFTGSLCIDTGDTSAVTETTDLDGEPRIMDGDGNGTTIVDMGAYEYYGPAYVPTVIYVDQDATAGDNNGSSWEDAFTSLQDALEVVIVGEQILVAKGTYTPDSNGLADPREATFQMKNQVAIYGGFPTGGSDFTSRNPSQYETILSGDLLGNDNPATSVEGLLGDPSRDDNCYHVFYHPLGTDLDSTAILDGFTITAANANENGANRNGSGMFNVSSSPTITNCIFTRNSAVNRGGGIYNVDYSSPALTNCVFSDNSADTGGGMFIHYSDLQITNCTFTGNFASNRGGGIYKYSSNTTLISCRFTGNSSGVYGGGIYYNSSGSNSTVSNCTFTGNSAISGGGMFNGVSDPTVTNCVFTENSADLGGGMFNDFSSSPMVTDCTFTDNVADGVYGSKGGGMYNEDSSPTVNKCTFTGNSADDGGGVYNYWSSPIITNCLFSENSAYNPASFGGGGGMYSYYSDPTVTGCIFTGNSTGGGGGGMFIHYGYPTINNCTFTGNLADYGGGIIDRDSSPTVTGCILWGNSASYGNEIALTRYSTLDADHCDIQGGQAGIYDDGLSNSIIWDTGNIDANPLFVDPNNDDYRLQPGSPCIDAGDPNYEPEPNETDLDGNPRIIDGDNDGQAVVDMGAYEFPPPLEAQMKLTPRTLNCSSKGNWLKAHFVLPEEVTIEDVDTNKSVTIDSLTILSDHMNVFYNNEGLVEIEVAFPRNDFCSSGLFGNLELTVRGWFTDETTFYGTDTIRITTNKLEQLPEFLSYWLQADCTGPDFCEGFDLNQNGTVDLADFVLLAEN